MKKWFIFLAVALIAGGVAFTLMRSHKVAERQALMRDCLPELAWVRTDLKLTDAQLAQVSSLHTAYLPQCMEMCRKISAARSKVTWAANHSSQVGAELETAIREHAETQAQCQQAMLRHLYETAALLNKDQSARFLETMIPEALEFDSHAPGSSHSR